MQMNVQNGMTPLMQLNAIREQYGCQRNAAGTGDFASSWSKRIVSAGLLVPKQSEVWPRNAPLLDLLVAKFEVTGFKWEKKEWTDKRGVKRRSLQFTNYPGASKGYVLTLADLYFLPVELVDECAAVLAKEEVIKNRTKKRKYFRGAYAANNDAGLDATVRPPRYSCW
jgi:hypothetical protein